MSLGTIFSTDRKYRYTLYREWKPWKPLVAFVGLNPSTANETQNDPTVTRCINFAKAWGAGRFCMLNLFGYRSTDPRGLYAVEDPVGFGNTTWIDTVTCAHAGLVVCAWGTHGRKRMECHERTVVDMLSRIMVDDGVPVCCLGKNADGSPKHPLYLRADSWPVDLWTGERWAGFGKAVGK